MLTESEKQWLRNKRLKGFRFDICRWCYAYPVASWGRAPSPCVIYCHDNGVPALCEGLHPARGLKDAAEFEGRVVANLAEMAQYNIKFGCEACPAYIDDAVPCKPYCAALLLKTARLAVEEEMDADGK